MKLARRAFHGTLDADAETALRTLYTNVRQMVDANGAVEAVVRSILLSPRFLFMIENGTPGCRRGDADAAGGRRSPRRVHLAIGARPAAAGPRRFGRAGDVRARSCSGPR